MMLRKLDVEAKPGVLSRAGVRFEASRLDVVVIFGVIASMAVFLDISKGLVGVPNSPL
jgi:hypothetical protein